MLGHREISQLISQFELPLKYPNKRRQNKLILTQNTKKLGRSVCSIFQRVNRFLLHIPGCYAPAIPDNSCDQSSLDFVSQNK